jgi:hypothetical protein
MKTILLALALLGTATGCSFAARSPEMYRDDTTKALQTKNEEIRMCYDGVLKAQPGAQGTVTVKFDVGDDGANENAGRIHNVSVDKSRSTAPDAVAQCVTKSITGLQISPADARKGEAVYSYEFTAPAGGKRGQLKALVAPM